MHNREKAKQIVLDMVIMLALLFVDQFTKYLSITHLKGTKGIVLIKGVLELQYVENRGIAFSMFQGRKILILLMGFLVLAVVLFCLFRIPQDKKFRIVHVLFAALIAGAAGNIIYRIRFDFVVDYISFVLIHFPVFNAADCFIVVSTCILLVLFLFIYKEEDLKFLSFH